MNYYEYEYNTWNDFKSHAVTDLINKDIFTPQRYIFRGQGSSDWELISSFDRSYQSFDYKTRKTAEKTLIDKFKALVTKWEGKERFTGYSEEQIISVAQHYGIPTRLIDWSYSIYVASFFAFANVSDYNGCVAIWVIDTNHEIWQGEYGVSIVEPYVSENIRQLHQKGAFCVNNSPEITLEQYVNRCSGRCNIDGALAKIIIPKDQQMIALNDLEMMGINYQYIYPGLEGCAKTAVLHEFITRNLK